MTTKRLSGARNQAKNTISKAVYGLGLALDEGDRELSQKVQTPPMNGVKFLRPDSALGPVKLRVRTAGVAQRFYRLEAAYP